MKRRSFALFFIVIAVVFGLRSLVDGQTRQFKVCVPDYSVGVMPFFVAKQNGYFAQEQIDIEVLPGGAISAPWD
jgi:ABC-type nitrate/sulfonate/bicarbonate transport system substrate-binding protein